MPKISVIIPVYNDEKYIAETLDSVLAQTFLDWDAVCINDGSTDNSLKILNQYAKKDKRIHVINQENSGVIVARTNGINATDSEYIFTLDGDDKIAPTTLEKMYHAITHKKGDIITSRVMQFGQKNGEMILPKPNKINMANQNCLVNAALMRKKDFIECGGFDTKFNAMLEDYDLWLNLLYRHNKKIYRIPEILFYYRIKPQSKSRNFQNYTTKFDNFMKFLHEKYPMKLWHNIGNICHYPKRIIRWFVKEKDYKIYFFGIPCFMHRHKRVLAYWFQDRSNFGDVLNPVLFNYFGYPLLHTSAKSGDVIAIGSLMELLFSDTKHRMIKRPLIVYGTGFIKAPENDSYLIRRLDVRAVRGYNTLARLKGLQGVKIADNVVVADPGLLSVLLVNRENIKKKYKLGVIPHYVDQENTLLKKIKCKNTTVIDITLDPVSFMKKIAECENIISSAMHGLIAADALGIPNIRMILSDEIYGGDYKFDDYYSAFGIKKHNRIDLRKKSFTEKDIDDLKNNYQITPEKVHEKQVELLKAFPYKIKRKICL